ncbi:MAG: hypothetical protein BWZ02_01887 [Lentisphaerae bacterium ADurb.BinA184]|nr:MAG: hypothetical protein BWZ02_01887 [Lentisphaerae bacterium ADurb.BinA184]
MTWASWVVAVLVGCGAFIFAGTAHNAAKRERADGERALREQRAVAEAALAEAVAKADATEAKCDAVSAEVAALELKLEQVKSDQEGVRETIVRKDQDIQALETEKDAAGTGQEKQLDDIQDLQEQIAKLERDVGKLNDALKMVAEEPPP